VEQGLNQEVTGLIMAKVSLYSNHRQVDDTSLTTIHYQNHAYEKYKIKLECGPVPNVMVALPNIGGALFNAAKFG